MIINIIFYGLVRKFVRLFCFLWKSLYNGIKHGFSCINIRQVPWEVLKTEAEGRGFQHLPRDLANVNAFKNHVRSLLLCNRKGEKIQITFFPDPGSNPVRRIQSPLLYHVAIKAGFYRKAVEVYLIPKLLHLHKNWKHLLHFALFLALFCFAFSPMSRDCNFHVLCSF